MCKKLAELWKNSAAVGLTQRQKKVQQPCKMWHFQRLWQDSAPRICCTDTDAQHMLLCRAVSHCLASMDEDSYWAEKQRVTGLTHQSRRDTVSSRRLALICTPVLSLFNVIRNRSGLKHPQYADLDTEFQVGSYLCISVLVNHIHSHS